MPKVGRRSDSQLWDGSSNDDKVLRNAPFGTAYTPVVRTKIVGGKPRYILDKESVKEDPRHVEPHADGSQHQMPRQQPQVKNAYQKETRTPDSEHYGRPRDYEHSTQVVAGSSHTAPPAAAAAPATNKSEPGGQGVQKPAWNSRPVLPPIGGNGQLLSKREPWHSQGDHEGSDSSPSEQLGGARQFDRSPQAVHNPDSLVVHTGYSPAPAAAGRGGDDSSGMADMRLARGDGPDRRARQGDDFAPLGPTQGNTGHRVAPKTGTEKELLLLRRLSEQLGSLDSARLLKDAYMELTSYDRSLSGWVDYRDIALALMRMKIFIREDDLRESASMFISYDHPGKVNYEKLLSYLSSAMQYRAATPPNGTLGRHVDPPPPKRRADWPSDMELQSLQSQLQQEHWPAQQPQLKHQTLLRGNRQSQKQSYSGSQSKLMHVVEEQLMSLDDGLDLEKLRQEFMLVDRLQRQTLSHKQIKDIVYRMRVPLQESVINQILDRCQTHGDGQYWWQDFVDFLERVQPVHTGLDIKPSKRPNEYARHYPVPDSSWPHVVHGAGGGDGSSHSRGNHYVQPASVRPDVAVCSDAEAKARSSNDIGQQSSSRLRQDRELPGLPPQAAAGSPTHRLHHHNHDTTVEDDWFDRFAFLAEALYRSDNKGEGLLPVDEARWLITKYDDVYQLGLPESSIRESLMRCSRGLSVAIDPLLRGLATATTSIK